MSGWSAESQPQQSDPNSFDSYTDVNQTYTNECVCMQLDVNRSLDYCTPSQHNPCADHSCLNGGSCTESDDVTNATRRQPFCNCPQGFTGEVCETPTILDPCANITCENNGTCVASNQSNVSSDTTFGADDDTSYTCACVDGFIGTYCEFGVEDSPRIGTYVPNGEAGMCCCQHTSNRQVLLLKSSFFSRTSHLKMKHKHTCRVFSECAWSLLISAQRVRVVGSTL